MSRFSGRALPVVAVAFALALGFPSLMNGQVPEPVPKVSEISVTGRGEVHVVPDRAVVLATVVSIAPTATAASAQNAEGVSRSIASLRAAGIPADRITNGGYSVQHDYENSDRRRPRGFVARNTIRVEVSDVANVGKAIDAAIAGGATEIAPIQFSGPNMPDARRNALRMAVAEARREAEVLAEAAGGSLGKLLSLTSAPAQPIGRVYEDVMATAAASSFPTTIRPNDVVVSAFASARWEFVPRR